MSSTLVLILGLGGDLQCRGRKATKEEIPSAIMPSVLNNRFTRTTKSYENASSTQHWW